MKYLPNILTGIRLLLIVGFVWLFQNDYVLEALVLFVIAFLTDLLDGYLARRNNWVSDVGKVLDPLADKLMLLSALTCFYLRNWIPVWLLVAVAAKELIMIVGGAVLYRRRVVVSADWYGKAAAGVFNAGVVATLLRHFVPALRYVDLVLFGVGVVLMLIALVHYAKQQFFSKAEKEE